MLKLHLLPGDEAIRHAYLRATTAMHMQLARIDCASIDPKEPRVKAKIAHACLIGLVV